MVKSNMLNDLIKKVDYIYEQMENFKRKMEVIKLNKNVENKKYGIRYEQFFLQFYQ